MRRTLSALVLAAVVGISSGCAKPLTLNQNTQNKHFACQPNRATIKEAANYIMLLEERPNFAAKGLSLPYDVADKQHVRCLDQILRGYGDGRYGIIFEEGDYKIMEMIH